MPPLGRIEFGGPDLAPRRLRDILQHHVDRSPPGSRIDWATYYFRDRALAEALMRASDRGVRVRLVLESDPRRPGANDAVIAMLTAHGLGGGLYLHAGGPGAGAPGHLHAKIYAFSAPEIAWVGSFNPSGDEPEDRAVIDEIGDQDRGHNLLLGIERPRLIAALRRFIDQLACPPRLPLFWRPMAYWRVRDGDTKLYFYPRQITLIAELEIARLRKGDRVRGAISHLKKGPLSKVLARAARIGVRVSLLVHDTTRRVSPKVVAQLVSAGVDIRRVHHPDGLPMHAKFLLIDKGKASSAWLGSYNFNHASRLANAELLLRTTDPATIAALAVRFEWIDAMADEADAQLAAEAPPVPLDRED